MDILQDKNWGNSSKNKNYNNDNLKSITYGKIYRDLGEYNNLLILFLKLYCIIIVIFIKIIYDNIYFIYSGKVITETTNMRTRKSRKIQQ